MKWFGDGGIIESAMDFFVERIFIPFTLLILVVIVVGCLGGGAYWGYTWIFPDPDSKTISLKEKYWPCTQAHNEYIAPYSCGAKIHSTCGGYSLMVCYQYSTRLKNGTIAGGGTEVQHDD